MSKSLRFTAACLITVFISLQALAQTVTIKGTVRNSQSKEAVPAVSVIIKGTAEGTYTDDNGNFSISTSAKLPVTLVFTSIGFDLKEVSVSNAATAVEIDFVAISTIGQEVVIAATRAQQRILDAPVTVERLGSAALRNAPAPNYYETLTNLKGVDMHTASLTFRTVTTRGFVSSGNSRFNQLIDGMDNQAPGLNFSVGNIVGLTELDVDNMELLSGASSALYGSGGMNGTLLITSKNPFKFQGLSFNVKQGIMHVDGKQRPASPYYDWSMRWAKAFNNKLAFKFTWQLVKAQDWEANDYDNLARTSILSKTKPGNRITDPNYDGVNVYGDETSARLDFMSVALGAQAQYAAGLAAAGIPNIVPTLNAIIPNGATYAQIQTILNATFTGPAAGALPTINQMLPFYWGLRNNWYQNNQFVSRTGYKEEDLVDYGALNFKWTAGLHYKLTPGIEASWNTYWGTGTSVYTGADRYSLRNFIVAQHKLEVRHKNWFLRGYTTQENAGEAYQATALGRLMQEKFSPSATVWYPTYVQNYYTKLYTDYATLGGTPSNLNAHLFARSVADANRPLPGTMTFENLKTAIRTTAIGKGGAKFLDRSDLWAAEGQLNISDALNFSDKLEMTGGFQWKQWVLNSQGTIFADTAGPIKLNEVGGYLQLKKKLFDEFLTLSAAMRWDKQTNFEGHWTPRFTAVMRVAKDHNIRMSYQTAYRFPTNQNQYIDLFTGSVTLIGALPEFITYYGLNTGTYTAESVAAARASSNTSLLQASTFSELNPESVSSGEIGYKGLWGKKLFVDVYAYYSRYTDFFASVAVVKSSSPANALNPLTSTSFSYTQNSTEVVKATGWGIGLEYQMNRGYIVAANLFSDVLRDVQPGFVSFFNAPKYRANLSLRNDNVYKNIGFNIIAKWQDVNHYEGTFVAGTLPSFTWVDAQVSYRMPKSKSVIRIGGSNIFNEYFRTGYGSPSVGGLYYISYGYNIF